MTTAAPGRASDRVALVLGGAGMAGLLAVAATRGLAVMAREVRFDVDPALDPTPLAALGPAGSLTLDVLLLLACAAVLAAAAIRRRGADWRLLLLAALPLPVLALHGLDDLGHLWRGATWGAAAVAAAVVAGLDAGRPAHRAAVGVVVALAVPLLARGALQVTVEHADTIALWEQTREAFLRDRGWSPDAPAARIYERRLREARPRGWFTTTNIFAAVMVATALASAGLAVAAGRARAAGGWIGGLALLAVAAAAGVVMSGSKGALLALVVGAVALGGWRWIRRLGPRGRGGLLLAMVAAALAAVLARGTLLPEGFAGDRSLLFRWHYLAAAGRIAVTHAGTGVGPDGFQAAYTLERPIRSPEEVTSAHSVFVDWVCMLGVAGIAWIALVGWLLWRAAVPRGPDDPGAAPGARAAAGPVVAAVAVAAAATVAIAVEWHVLDPLGLAVRGLGALGMAVVAIAIAGGRGDGAAGLVRWSLAAAAATLVMHAQIEMTFFEPGAIVWALVAVGAAAAGPARRCARAPVVVAAGACVAL
ncbi:MAG: O-antigen ligase family protein, partial [Planctomycetota bacterium]